MKPITAAILTAGLLLTVGFTGDRLLPEARRIARALERIADAMEQTPRYLPR